MEAVGSVPGTSDRHRVRFFGLSTCVWCRRTRRLLEANAVPFEFSYVDLLDGDRKQEALDELGRWNARLSYPTLIIDEKTCIVGYKPDQIKEALDI